MKRVYLRDRIRAMSVILFYSPFNQRSRDTESLMIAFRVQGHRVISLSQQDGRGIHAFLESKGVETYSFKPKNSNPWIRHCRHLVFLILFCWRNKVTVVYSHLEPANFIAAIAQFFVRARVFICRHHADQYHLLGREQDWSYKTTYRLARNIIVFSEVSKKYMVEHEGVAGKKVRKINLAYDFSLYAQPDSENIEQIKKKLGAKILLITVGSLLPLKRPEQSIYVLKELIDKGYDAALILLGSGPLDAELRTLSNALELQDKILFAGYVSNVLDYVSASSVLLHPSVSESSCVAVKEAGLVRKPVIVCQGVGDFDDYIVHGHNGFSTHIDSFLEEAVDIIEMNYKDENRLDQLGENLKKSVLDLFSIENVLPLYGPLNNTR
jgi:glycosyltransferase involved in cell wall biosynthesis